MNHRAEKSLFRAERIQTIDKMLLEKFPVRSVLVLSLLNVFIAFGSFLIQLFSIIKQTYLYYLAFGYLKNNNINFF